MKSVERSNVLGEGWLALSFGLLMTVMTIGTLRDVGQVVGSGQVSVSRWFGPAVRICARCCHKEDQDLP